MSRPLVRQRFPCPKSRGRIRYWRDRNGNLLTVTDAKNQTTTYTYDAKNRVVTRADALNRQETYNYDFAGNLSQFTDRKNQQTTFEYDVLNRRTKATYPDATTTFVYDAVGRLTKTSDTATGAGTIDFAYDALDRLIQETTGQGSVSYQYDVLGRRTQMTANGQQPTIYQYDAASRLTRVEQGSLFAALGYDNTNRRTSLGYSNGTTTSYAYDLASRLTGITYNGPSGLIEALTYQYDAAGNRTSLTRNNAAASLLPAAVASATYDPANEQTTFAGATLTYDANGNLTNDGINTYQWDARNRLIGMSGGTSGSFGYDPLGRRVAKTVGGATSSFLYDGHDVAAEIGGGAVGANYVRSLNIDEPFVRQAGTGNEFYHTDALGSSLALSNAQGASGTTYTYEPFGKTTVTGGSSNPFQYTGRENDGIGLYYYRSRIYSQRLSRFIGEDPIGMAGGLNKYAYARNNPVRYVDPFGWKEKDPLEELPAPPDEMVCLLIPQCQLDTPPDLLPVVPGPVSSQKPQDPYVPNRSLPRDPQSGKPVPDVEDAAHTQMGTKTSKRRGETYPQAREFDSNGNPVRDIDFTNHGRTNHTNPHEHRYDPNTGARGPNQPLK